MASEIEHPVTHAADVHESRARAERRQRLITRADSCVACGMCLPRCPTYTDARTEAESPRGRIAVIRGLAEGGLEASATVQAHLDHCLVCGACEAVCPAGVEYGQIIDEARALLIEEYRGAAPQESRAEQALAWAVRQGPRLHGAGRVISLYQKSGLRRLMRRTGLLRGIGLQGADRKLPDVPLAYSWQIDYPAQGPERGRVALFTGCVANLFDRQTLHAAIRVLTRLGYAVHVPKTQGCCGAIDLHAGRREAAFELVRNNLRAFAELEVDAVVNTASGCGAVVAAYGGLDLADPAEQAAGSRLAEQVRDISQFLVEIDWPEDIAYTALSRRVAVHSPCTLKNALKQQARPVELLQRIPGLDVVVLAEDTQCCGAAGTNMLRNPDLADRLGAKVLEQVNRVGAEVLVTSNIGCGLHLGGLAPEGLEILHPVTLLDRVLDRPAGRS